MKARLLLIGIVLIFSIRVTSGQSPFADQFEQLSIEDKLHLIAVAQVQADREKQKEERQKKQETQQVAQAAWNQKWKDAADHADETKEKALRYNIDLALKGDDYGEYRMGQRCRDGEDVPKDLVQARKWLAKSADHGNKFAAKELAHLTNEFPECLIETVPVAVTSTIASTNKVSPPSSQ